MAQEVAPPVTQGVVSPVAQEPAGVMPAANNGLPAAPAPVNELPAGGCAAQIGGTGYATLQNAVTAAQENDTITLLRDAAFDSAMDGDSSAILITNNGITLDGGGRTITVIGEYHGIQVYGATGVTIQNVTITGAGKDALLVNGGANVTARNLSTSGSGWGAVNVDKGSTLTAAGLSCAETVKVWSETYPDDPAMDSTVEVAGFVTASGVDGTKVHYTTEDGKNALLEEKGKTIVAKVGGAYYAALQAAIDAAGKSETVTMLADTTVASPVSVDKKVTLDLGTFYLTLNAAITVTNSGDLTVNADENGKVTCNVIDAFAVSGKLLINGGEYESTSQDIVNSKGTTTIKGGTFKCTNYVQAGHILNVTGGTMTVEAGTFDATVGGFKLGDGIYDGIYGINVRNGATLILGDKSTGKGPAIISVYAPIGMNNQTAPGTFVCYGGTYTCTLGLVNETKGWEKFNTAVYLSGDSKMDIYGGSFVVNPGANATKGCKTFAISIPYQKPKVELNIHGGDFQCNDEPIYIPNYSSTDGSGEGSTVKIDGGTFSGDVSNYRADGYVCVENEGGTDPYIVKLDESSDKWVARIGNVGYPTLQAAINKAKMDTLGKR